MTQDNGNTHEPERAGQLLAATPAELTFSSERREDEHVITLHGELDLATAGDLERELMRVEASGVRSIVIDLAGLTFMDSTGIRLMLSADARARDASISLSLRRGPLAVQRVFELTGLVDLLPFAN
jgi:anti-anti-sigma factor